MCPKDEAGCALAGGLVVVAIEAGWRPTSRIEEARKRKGFYGELGGNLPSNWRHLLVDIQLIHQLGFCWPVLYNRSHKPIERRNGT